MNTTIIIPSYESGDTIERCLQSLLNQNTKAAFEIILVDSSPNKDVDNIANRFPKVRLIKLRDRTYAGIARNIGAKQARGELLIFVDADIVLSDDWVENAIQYHGSGHDVFAGSIDLWNHKKESMMGKLEYFFEQSEFKPSMKESARWFLSSTALAVQGRIFHKERFNDMQSSEDVDFTVRLRKSGHTLYFNPKLKAFHIFHTSFKELWRKAYNFGLSNMQNRKEHNLPGAYFVHKPVLRLFAIPGFAVVKFTRISWRNFTHNDLLGKGQYVLMLPLMIILISAWIAGCYKELLAPMQIKGRSKERLKRTA